jgi:alpha-L-fucosidase
MDGFSRRSFVKRAGAIAALAGASEAVTLEAQEHGAPQTKSAVSRLAYQEETRSKRLRWWREAKFGMFVHWGLYSVIGHQEWVLESEGIPIEQYEVLAKHWKPKQGAAREWARLAKRAGQKYIVLTAKHHEGFCLWDSKLTNYNAARQGPGRDLVREFVEAARAEGLRVGLYYSLMDWHHPDGERCASDEAARERFVTYTHGLLRELLTNYGKIDILWYDVDKPLTLEQWRADKMNRMVFQLQPEIIVNNRNGLPGDFSTPEHKIQADNRAWESCETMNLGWGWQRNDTEWKSSKRIVNDLATCAQQGGNYLLNIGPEPDGTVPTESVKALEAVGSWLQVNGRAIYATDGGASVSFGNYDNFTRKGNTLYIHVYFWPSKTAPAAWMEFYRPEVVVAVGGVQAKVLSAKVLKTGQSIPFTQTETSVRIMGLPVNAPDELITVLEVECAQPPVVDHHSIRPKWKRLEVDIS